MQKPLTLSCRKRLGDTDISSRRDVHTVNITVATALCAWGSESYKRVESMTARENLGVSLGTFGPSIARLSMEAGRSGVYHCQVYPVQANVFPRLLWGWTAHWCL